VSLPVPVALARCADYDQELVDAAVAAACQAAGPPAVAGSVVLVKPNLLNASEPERAATTHPAVVRAVIRYLRAKGAARVLVGDSPGWQPADVVAARAGILPVVRAEGAEWVDFSEAVSVDVPGASLVRRFELARPVVESDFVVSVAKLKNHGLMYFTGAVKNLFGAVPGLRKSAFHLRFPGRAEFARMLADLALAVGPRYAVMDAVVGMDGPGPNAGHPRPLGLVLASRDCWSLDWVAAELVGYHPAHIPYLGVAAADDRYGFRPGSVERVGDEPDHALLKRFAKVRVLKETDFFKAEIPSWIHGIVRNLAVPKPEFSDARCVRCAGCVRICPAKALEFREGSRAPAVDYSKCIRCYCCHEVCPEDAIRLVRRPW